MNNIRILQMLIMDYLSNSIKKRLKKLEEIFGQIFPRYLHTQKKKKKTITFYFVGHQILASRSSNADRHHKIHHLGFPLRTVRN